MIFGPAECVGQCQERGCRYDMLIRYENDEFALVKIDYEHRVEETTLVLMPQHWLTEAMWDDIWMKIVGYFPGVNEFDLIVSYKGTVQVEEKLVGSADFSLKDQLWNRFCHHAKAFIF